MPALYLVLVVGLSSGALVVCLALVLLFCRWALKNGHDISRVPDIVRATLSPWRRERPRLPTARPPRGGGNRSSP